MVRETKPGLMPEENKYEISLRRTVIVSLLLAGLLITLLGFLSWRNTQPGARHLPSSIIGLGSSLGVASLISAGVAVLKQLAINARARARVELLNNELEQRVAERA